MFSMSMSVFSLLLLAVLNLCRADQDTAFRDFSWSQNQHNVPQFVHDAAQPTSDRFMSLLDKSIVRAPWHVLAAKMVRVVSVFFLESYLVQLFGVTLPLP